MKRIELYFEGIRVETDGDTAIRLSKQLNDIYDPAKITIEFSKTVSLPSTQGNNELFGKIYDVTKIIDTGSALNIGKGFNPSKKTNFKLFVNDSLLYSGYAKLLNIKFESKYSWRYETALYGELGNFLQSFEDFTLKDLLASGTPYATNRIRFNRFNIFNLWQARITAANNRENIDIEDLYAEPFTTTQAIASDFTGTIRNTYIDLIDSENGLYDAGDKVEFSEGFNSDAAKNVTKLDGKYSEQQLCIKKSYRQRFGFYLDILIATMLKKVGYTLGNIGGAFLNTSNPYWYKLMLAAPILDTVQAENINLTATGTAANITTEVPGNVNYLIAPKPSSLTANASGISLGAELTDNGTVLDGGMTITPVKFEQTNYSKYYINYIMSNPPDAMFSPQMAIGTWSPASEIGAGYYVKFELYYRVYDYNTGLSTLHTIPSSTIWLVDAAAADAAGNADNRAGKYLFRFIVSHETNPVNVIEVFDKKTATWVKLSQVFKAMALQRSVEVLSDSTSNKGVAFMYLVLKNNSGSVRMTNGSSTPAMSAVTINYNQPNFSVSIQHDGRMGTNAEARYLDLLPNVKARELLVSYIRLFGLYLDVDEGNKTVSLLTRNEFYANSEMMDWNAKLDISREVSITPLNFESKYIKAALKDGDTDFAKKYKEKYGKTFGEQLLNTGYSFNESTYELFRGTVFDTYCAAGMLFDAYGANGEPKVIPQLYSNELEKSKPANGLYLVFANGYHTTPSPVVKIPNTFYFIVTDDSEEMVLRNEMAYNLSRLRSYIDANGWFRLARESAGDVGAEVTANRMYLQTTPFYPSPDNVKCSLDFAVSQEQYFSQRIPQAASIYDRFWKAYLEDRYSVQTKVMACYIYMNDADYNRFTFSNFVHLKGRVWAVNRVIDYSPLDNEPTRVELVSVNDLEAYKEGQKLNFDTI